MTPDLSNEPTSSLPTQDAPTPTTDETAALPTTDETTPLPTEASEESESRTSHAEAHEETPSSPTPSDTSATTTDLGISDMSDALHTQKVWTAADAPLDSRGAPVRKVKVGQLIWGCIVALLGVFIIAIPFIDAVNVPILLISLVGALGLSLIAAAFFVNKATDR